MILSVRLLLLIFVLMMSTQIALSQEGCLCFEEIAKELKNPTVLVEADDGTGRLFVVTQEGIIYIYYKDGKSENQPFLDIRDRVEAEGGNELGLVGFVPHTNFKNNGRFFVYYLTRDNKQLKSRLSEFKVSPTNKNKGDPKSEKIMLEWIKVSKVHHSGQLLFDTKGMLLVLIGDGGPQRDTLGNGQNKNVLFGKVLRLNVTSTTKTYTIPRDNPFRNDPNARPEVYAYGFRNPWVAKMDYGDPKTKKGRGRIFIGDVGQASMEEIDILQRGGNFGWNCFEGTMATSFAGPSCSTNPNDYIKPIYAYGRGMGRSVTGGAVYRGCQSPNLNGLYIFGDYGSGKMWYLTRKRNVWDATEIPMCDECPGGLAQFPAFAILNFGQDLEGEIYVLATDRVGQQNPFGAVHRIVDPTTYGKPNNCKDHPFGSPPGSSGTTRRPPKKTKRPRKTTTKRPRKTTKRPRKTTTKKPPCGLDRTWKATIRRGNNRCENCSCRQLSREEQLFEFACKRNRRGARTACCRLCRRAGHI